MGGSILAVWLCVAFHWQFRSTEAERSGKIPQSSKISEAPKLAKLDLGLRAASVSPGFTRSPPWP